MLIKMRKYPTLHLDTNLRKGTTHLINIVFLHFKVTVMSSIMNSIRIIN